MPDAELIAVIGSRGWAKIRAMARDTASVGVVGGSVTCFRVISLSPSLHPLAGDIPDCDCGIVPGKLGIDRTGIWSRRFSFTGCLGGDT